MSSPAFSFFQAPFAAPMRYSCVSGPSRRQIGVVMKSRALLVPSAILVLVSGAWLWVRLGRTPRVEIDLAAAFRHAEKRTNVPETEQAFNIERVALAGVRKQGILARPSSRITWDITVPEGAMLETAYGMREDSWDKPGADGAQFRIAVAGGGEYEELARHYVNPSAVRSDRRWQTVSLDLSRFGGRVVRIIFSTDPGPPSSTNTAYDYCVWAEPRVVSGR